MANGGRADDEISNIEKAGLILARAWGYGSAWPDHATADWADVAVEKMFSADGQPNPNIHAGGRLCRETWTEEKANTSVTPYLEAKGEDMHAASLRERTALTDAQRAALLQWERDNPLAKGNGRNPRRVRELEAWSKNKTVVATARSRPSRESVGALAYASLHPVELALLHWYALGDMTGWPLIQYQAVKVGHDPFWFNEAAGRLLYPHIAPSQAERALNIGIRKATYAENLKAPTATLIRWLDAVAVKYLSKLNPALVGNQKPLPEGEISRGVRTAIAAPLARRAA